MVAPLNPIDPLGGVEPMGADSLAWGAVGDRPVAARVESHQAMPLGVTVEASLTRGRSRSSATTVSGYEDGDPGFSTRRRRVSGSSWAVRPL